MVCRCQPEGKVVRILGAPSEHTIEMNAIIVEYGLPESFPDEVEKETLKFLMLFQMKKLKTETSESNYFLDPIDAKDFDDTLSIQQLPNGNWEMGVHIADVFTFLKPGSAMDEEAFNRATSIYLVDRVISYVARKIVKYGLLSKT